MTHWAVVNDRAGNLVVYKNGALLDCKEHKKEFNGVTPNLDRLDSYLGKGP